MELLPVVCLCLLTRCGITSADGNEPLVVPVEQDGDALLPCSLSTKANIEQGYFDWNKVPQSNEKKKEVFLYDKGRHSNTGFGSQDDGFKDRVSHFQEELKQGNASIIIRNTKMADNGEYTCTFTEPRQTFHIKLVVGRVLKDRTDENIPGAAPKPVIRSLDETENRALLQCEVHGNPEPEVEWRDSAGNTLPAEKSQEERDRRFYVTLNTTVTKTDHYRCVATQKSISHQIYTETFLRMNELTVVKVEEGSSIILPCSLSTKKNIESEMFEWKKDGQKEVFLYDAGIHYNNGRAGQSEEFKGRVFHFTDNLKHGDASIIIRNTKLTDNGNYTCVFPHLQPRQTFHIELVVVETGAHSSGSPIVAVVVTFFVTLILVLVVLAVLVYKRRITLHCNKDSPADQNDGSAVPLKSQPSRSQEAPDPLT